MPARRLDRDSLADRQALQKRLIAEGWTGDHLGELVRSEMHHLLLDDPRLSADHLAQLLSKQGKSLPRG